MKKLKIKRKGFSFELVLDGDVTVDKTKIKPYEEYVKEETDKQIIIQHKLDTNNDSDTESDNNKKNRLKNTSDALYYGIRERSEKIAYLKMSNDYIYSDEDDDDIDDLYYD